MKSINSQLSDLKSSPFASLILDKNKLFDKIILNKIENSWEKIIGPIFYNQSKPINVIEGKLIVIVAHSAYKLELNMMNQYLLNQINGLLENRHIKKIEIRIGEIKYNQKPLSKKNYKLEGKEHLIPIIENQEDEFKNKLIELIKRFD